MKMTSHVDILVMEGNYFQANHKYQCNEVIIREILHFDLIVQYKINLFYHSFSFHKINW